MSNLDKETNILVVDDSKTDLEIISIVCDALGCNVDVASTGYEALQLFREKRHEVVLSDYMMEPLNGVQVIKLIKDVDPHTLCLLVTGFPNAEVRELADDGVLYAVVTKPIRMVDLKETLRVAFNRSRGATEKIESVALANRMDECDVLSGDSLEARKLREQVSHSIYAQKPILITGPGGLGKRKIVRFIHDHGTHAGNPLVEVLCSSMDEAKCRSELITADGEWGPILRGAVGSTLLLDEITDLPIPVQQDFTEQFDKIASEMHLVALSDYSLEDALEQGKIDDEFYFRVTMEHLNVQAESVR